MLRDGIRGGAIEDDMEIVILPKSVGRAVIVQGQCDFAVVSPSFHLDKANVDSGLGVFGMFDRILAYAFRES